MLRLRELHFLVYPIPLRSQHLLHGLAADAEFPRDVSPRKALGDQLRHHRLALLVELLGLDPVRECFGLNATKLIEVFRESAVCGITTRMTTRIIDVNQIGLYVSRLTDPDRAEIRAALLGINAPSADKRCQRVRAAW